MATASFQDAQAVLWGARTVGAAWALGGTRRAGGAASPSRVDGTFPPAVAQPRAALGQQMRRVPPGAVLADAHAAEEGRVQLGRARREEARLLIGLLLTLTEERCELGQPLQPRSLDGVRVLLRCRLGYALTGEEALVRRLRPKVSDLRTRTGRRESRVRKAEGRKRRGAARRVS